MAEVCFREASRIFPGSPPVYAVDNLELDVADGEFLVLVGPSGSGKSTALRMLAGLEDVDRGRIVIDGRDVTEVSPKDRDIAMVFQNYALYPHMSVADNMAFALTIKKVAKPEIQRRVEEAAEMLDLTRYLDRKPKALSGGQRQRVAMGRAIVREPSVFLMDEPLSNLDAKLRVETRANITSLQRKLATTTVYVTHDQVEAMTMGTRVAVLRDGKLQQCATPRELYRRPVNAFVAGFIGSPAMNLYKATLTPHGVIVDGHQLPVVREVLAKAADAGVIDVLIGVRPEDLRAVGEDEPGISMIVDLREELGSDTYVYGRAGSGERCVIRMVGGADVDPGTRIRVVPHTPDTLHLFDAESGRRLADPA